MNERREPARERSALFVGRYRSLRRVVEVKDVGARIHDAVAEKDAQERHRDGARSRRRRREELVDEVQANGIGTNWLAEKKVPNRLLATTRQEAPAATALLVKNTLFTPGLSVVSGTRRSRCRCWLPRP